MLRAVLTALTWCLFAALALVDWVAVARADRRTEAVAKPAALLALTAVAAVGGAAGTAAGTWLVVALLLGALGDWFLLADSDGRFVAGLGAFLLGHLAYVACFATLGTTTGPWLVAGLVALVAALVPGRRVLPSVLRAHGLLLAVPVAVYTAVIGAMLGTGWATAHPLIAVGAAVFVLSDTVLALDRFDRPAGWAAPYPHLVVMVTYHLGQGIIVAGVLRAL